MGARSLSGSDDAPGDGDDELEGELGEAELLFCCGSFKIMSGFDVDGP